MAQSVSCLDARGPVRFILDSTFSVGVGAYSKLGAY